MKTLSKALLALFLLSMSINVDLQAMNAGQPALTYRRIKNEGGKTTRPLPKRRRRRQTCPFCFEEFSRKEFLYLHIDSCQFKQESNIESSEESTTSPRPSEPASSPSIAEYIEWDTGINTDSSEYNSCSETDSSDYNPSESEKFSPIQFFHCNYCYASFHFPAELDEHLLQTHNIGLLQKTTCPFCNYTPLSCGEDLKADLSDHLFLKHGIYTNINAS